MRFLVFGFVRPLKKNIKEVSEVIKQIGAQIITLKSASEPPNHPDFGELILFSENSNEITAKQREMKLMEKAVDRVIRWPNERS